MQQRGSHRDLFQDYVRSHVTACAEPGPCRDEDVLRRGAQLLLRDPGVSAALTCRHVPGVVPSDPAHMHVLVRATELLETLCLHLHLQPWRRDIRSLKTFTGAFVYCLLPALGGTTLQSVLASVGYFPSEPSLSPSSYSLCEDASPDVALRVAFQLVLTRGLCLHLLQRHDRPSVQVCVETLQRKLLPAAQSQRSENTAISTEARGGGTTEGGDSGLTEDQSIPHLHLTYPDLVFRGRPLLPGDAPLSQHTSHRQRVQVPPGYVSPTQGPAEEEGLSGPPGLTLHITLRKHTVQRPTCVQHQSNADMSGVCEENCDSPVKCEDEEVPEDQSYQS